MINVEVICCLVIPDLGVLATIYILNTRIIGRLSTMHKSTYEALGKPSLGNSPIMTNYLFTKFILLRRYKKLSDKRLRVLCDAALSAILVVLTLTMTLVLVTRGQGMHT